LLARPDNSYKACRSQENKLHRGLEKQKTADELFARPTTVSIVTVPVSGFVSKRATDRGQHQTLIEAQWFG